ncbi:MAG: CDP-alcohol phosphatidyltransferase family protein [Candidatus Lokiarchaeota archaeon]|nr:CDP-alcohol phosphatidyltransferase family protein [Candidatus Lokiarchaeota archaeon]
MIDKWLSKTKLNGFIEKVVKKLFYEKISANSLTLLALITGLLSSLSIFLSGVLIWEIELIICAVSLMILSFFLDVLDGALARIEGPTIFGGILDIFSDRTVEVLLIISLVSLDQKYLMWPGIFSLGSIILCITMFLLIGGAVKAQEIEETKKVIYYRKSLMERGETFILLLLITVIVPWRALTLWIFAFLVFLTAILRLRDAYLLLKNNNNS